MKIDPGNKIFVAVLSIVMLGVVGFLIASIFINVSDDVEIKTIHFSRSKFSANIKQLKSDKRYVVEIYIGESTIYMLEEIASSMKYLLCNVPI